MSKSKRPTLRDAELLGQQNHAALLKLQDHFGICYEIHVTFPDKWTATRIGEPQTVLRASSDTELRRLIVADHESRPLNPDRRPSLRVNDDE